MPAGTAPIAETASGMLRGLRDSRHGTLNFRGIRYGESPIKTGRFRAPAPAPSWEGLREATEFGPVCPQTGKVGSHTLERKKLPHDEDCLFLNVWTPALDGARPVMVWLHGRGFAQGAGSEPLYDGAALAKRGDVVVVTINHRLNVFGYLHLAELAGAEYTGSGLAGMLDAELALRWVRDHIRAFGGDPKNVTIFGESGGGLKVSTLLAMPSAQGLFHRAIIQSGPGIRCVSSARASERARRLMQQLQVEDASELDAVPADRLLEAALAVTARWEPVMDGNLLPVHPFDPTPAPTATGIPIMIGATRDETALFLMGDPRRSELTMDELRERTRKLVGEHADSVVEAFSRSRPAATPWDLYVAITSQRFHTGSVLLAERQSAASPTPIWMYVFDYAGASPIGAAHGLEIAYAFGNASGTRPHDADVARVEADMCDAWTAFARSGDPNHPGIPTWPAYDARSRSTMLFDAPSRVESDPRSAERVAFQGVALGRS